MSIETTAQLVHELRHNHCTDHYYRHQLCKGNLATDGAIELFEKAGAFWLWDIIATEVFAKINE